MLEEKERNQEREDKLRKEADADKKALADRTIEAYVANQETFLDFAKFNASTTADIVKNVANAKNN